MNGSGFDGITNPSASSMGLDEAAQIRVEASPAIYFAYEVLFRSIMGGQFLIQVRSIIVALGAD